jgi:hypothetical protein
MAPPALGPEIYGLGFRFNPTPQEAVTYYLPRLVSGDPRALHEAVRPVIHHAEVYACDPADLARRFRPMPRTHNRFFFTVIKKGVRAAGPGSWAGQSTAEIKDKQGVQIGELRKFRYKKRGVLTDWLMEEYSSCGLDGAGDGGMQFALCKVYVSPKAAPNSDAYKESAACFATPPPAAPAVITQPAAAKRPAPPQDVTPPCAKRMRVPAVQPAPPPQPPAPPAPTLSSLTAVRKMHLAPPQPCVPRRGSTPQPSPASAPPPAPPAPTRSHLASIRKMSFAPPQPYAPRRGLLADSVTRPSPAPIQAPALPVPIHPPRPLAQPKEQVPLPTPQVIRASLPKQRRILDPFEASMLRDEAEEQTVAAAPHLPESPAAAPALQDVDDDDLVKALEDAMSTAEAEEQTVAAALQDEDEDEDGWDELDKEIEDAMRTAEADEETVTAAPARLQDDDDFAKVIEDMLSAEAEQPTVAALEFDVDAVFNFSEETRLRVCLPQADHAIKV